MFTIHVNKWGVIYMTFAWFVNVSKCTILSSVDWSVLDKSTGNSQQQYYTHVLRIPVMHVTACILCLPNIVRKNVTQFFEVCDVEQGNLLIYQSTEV